MNFFHFKRCFANDVPKNTICREDRFCALRIEGVLDFSLIGILAKITTILSENKIGVFVASTYNTDYIFAKEKDLRKAIKVLQEKDYFIV